MLSSRHTFASCPVHSEEGPISYMREQAEISQLVIGSTTIHIHIRLAPNTSECKLGQVSIQKSISERRGKEKWSEKKTFGNEGPSRLCLEPQHLRCC